MEVLALACVDDERCPRR